MMEFWNNLQLPSLHQAWSDFPPAQRGLTVLMFAFFFGLFFVRDYNRGGRGYILYGPIALVLFIYAASQFDLF